jgi:hypothetical protein
MTEAEWNSCTDPRAMLDFLRTTGRTSDRKLRLFAYACCRYPPHSLWDWSPVEAAERYADGLADRGQLEGIRTAALATAGTLYRHLSAEEVEAGSMRIDAATASEATEGAMLSVQAASVSGTHPPCALLHDIFGPLPFREVRLAPSFLAWHEDIIPKLAQGAYEDRSLPGGTLDKARLAVLADALEESGYSGVEILGHLRGPGPHVRGCYAVDAILGRS